jgi:hypothetical protein
MVSKSTFLSTAGILVANIGGTNIVATARRFSTGSMGWYLNGKVNVTVPAGITKDDFGLRATPIRVTIGGQTFEAKPSLFGTGSLGWVLNAKVTVNGHAVQISGLRITIVKSKENPNVESGLVKAQVGANIVAVGSKEWAEGAVVTVTSPAPVVATRNVLAADLRVGMEIHLYGPIVAIDRAEGTMTLRMNGQDELFYHGESQDIVSTTTSAPVAAPTLAPVSEDADNGLAEF